MAERLPSSTLPDGQLATAIAASPGMGCGCIHVVVDGDLLMWSAAHSDYARLGEWAWVGREEPAPRPPVVPGWTAAEFAAGLQRLAQAGVRVKRAQFWITCCSA